MKFTINVTTDCENDKVLEECLYAVARVLKSKNKYFEVGYIPQEVVKAKC